MEFNHLGVATDNIRKSIETFEKLGFASGKVIFDDIQLVNICFLKKDNHPDIELIEPVNEKSPVRNILDKVGTTPYHICYTTKDLQQEILCLKQNGFILVVTPVNAIAFEMRKICFLYNKNFGLLELVEI
jgi:methylmalonyl-CoA/ethylmalonyl-CoA epimerase